MDSMNTSSNQERILTIQEMSEVSNRISQMLLTAANPAGKILEFYDSYRDKNVFVAALASLVVTLHHRGKFQQH